MEQTKEEAAWKEGYEAGLKQALEQKKLAISIGEAILDVLDERYEIKGEDY